MTLHDRGADAPELGRLRLVLQDPLWGALRVWVRIDGAPVPTAPGENLIPVTPGPHTIEFDEAWRPPTSGTFEATAGETVSLWFAPGFTRLELGGVGPEPQRTRGPIFLALVGAIIVVGLLVELLRS